MTAKKTASATADLEERISELESDNKYLQLENAKLSKQIAVMENQENRYKNALRKFGVGDPEPVILDEGQGPVEE